MPKIGTPNAPLDRRTVTKSSHRATPAALDRKREREVEMTTRAAEIRDAEDEVVAAVESATTPPSPFVVIDLLKDKGLREDAIRVALWYLLDEKRIRLTRDRVLAPAPALAAANGNGRSDT